MPLSWPFILLYNNSAELAHDCKPIDTDLAKKLNPAALVTKETCAKQVARETRLVWLMIWRVLGVLVKSATRSEPSGSLFL